MAVRQHAEFHLLQPDGIAQVEIQVTGDVAHLVAERGQLLLQGDAVLARRLRRLLRPFGADNAAAMHAVGEEADGESVDVGVVETFDGVEILGDQKSRTD